MIEKHDFQTRKGIKHRYAHWPSAHYGEVNRPISQISQCTCPISHKFTSQNRNVHISVLNCALWDMEQKDCAIYEFGLFSKAGWLVDTTWHVAYQLTN